MEVHYPSAVRFFSDGSLAMEPSLTRQAAFGSYMGVA
jgi:hypothetical protein